MRASDHASDGRSIQHDKISQIQDDAERGRGVPVILVDSSLDTSTARRRHRRGVVSMPDARRVTGILKDVFMS